MLQPLWSLEYVKLNHVRVEGDGSESANSSAVSISELLNCEIVV